MAIDLAAEGRSLLMLGRPGVGKTTAIRELSRSVYSTYLSCICMHAYLSCTANELLHWCGLPDQPLLHRSLATQRQPVLWSPDTTAVYKRLPAWMMCVMSVWGLQDAGR